jgi:hypothetical protein
MPWGYLQAGLLGGTIVLFSVALVSFETAKILLVVQEIYYNETKIVKSYPEIAQSCLGDEFLIIIKIATGISCIGGCVGYAIFLGDLSIYISIYIISLSIYLYNISLYISNISIYASMHLGEMLSSICFIPYASSLLYLSIPLVSLSWIRSFKGIYLCIYLSIVMYVSIYLTSYISTIYHLKI